MNPAQFVSKWSRVDLPERAASQEHFIDLCRLLGQPTPAEHDATGAEYAFEKGVEVAGSASKGSKGDRGFADVWWKSKFGWEYKRKDKYKSLDEAYRQLLQYREALESPPLLIVSDIARTEIHTNFTGTKKEVHTIALADMDQPRSLDLLRRAFTDPESFRPTITAEKITQDVAAQLGKIAEGLRKRGNDPHEAAHFLMKCMFCLFAEDVKLLPDHVFKKLLEKFHHEPAKLTPRLTALFGAMRTGGPYGNDDIAYFNGGLFDDKPALELTEGEVGLLNLAAAQDWGSVEPAIFGTLFERSLDPAKRSQIGAHYTSREDILLVVEPVILEPLRREWAETRAKVSALLEKRAPLVKKALSDKTSPLKKQIAKMRSDIEALITGFLDRVSSLIVLDPACGSGNFLYVAIQKLLELEKEVITFAAKPEIGLGLIPRVRPTQLRGIEINPYASELAQVVIWIGYLQWMRDNGFNPPSNPILSNLSTIENRDAILKVGKNGEPLAQAAEWPEADFIIGNPPFLGSKVFRQNGLEETYIQAMFGAYDLPKTSDLCCYWFELARRAIEKHKEVRAGLLATQGIRGGDNRTVLERIKESGNIFMAWSDREWVLDGAAVQVSMIGFDSGTQSDRRLDGRNVADITPDLATGANLTTASRISDNADIGFMGDTKGGPFDISLEIARSLLGTPNPSDAKNYQVVMPWVNGSDFTRRWRSMWIIDFGVDMSKAEAAKHDAPFAFVEENVKPMRSLNRRVSYAQRWWIHVEPRPAMRSATSKLERVLVTPNLTKYRIFAWLPAHVLADHQLIVFARQDDCFFGFLHSSIHELWARRMGTQLREAESGFRYTPTTCFETFPLPWAPGKEPTTHDAYKAIAAAAKDLDTQRERWLNPPEWIEPIAKRIDAADTFEDVPREARALIRQSAIMAAAAQDPKLKKRTLTNLYNERPTWLRLAHERLDRAVLAAYAAVDPKGGWKEDWAEVWVETGAGQPLPSGHALEKRRGEVEERVLGNLLRMNGERV
ncbi:MAG: class I SAM-dependent DNA methyltransferase [Phycisphaeraceae bacterium]|nr:class I SAM-dependent DNA methyltransferase [Phycisphaeraceae bacterium]